MAVDVIIPDDLWEENEVGVISTWLFDNGAQVAGGDILAEVMVEKVTHELLAPCGGTLQQIVPAEEQTVTKGTKVAELI